MSLVALSEILGAAVRDASGVVQGRVRELAVAPLDDPTRVAFIIVRTPAGERVLPRGALQAWGTTVRTSGDAAVWEPYTPSDGVLLLKRDLLDQQIIDVHGRKVVRVTDVEMDAAPANGHLSLHVVAVDVGARAAIRRLSTGVIPRFPLRLLLEYIPPRAIPWQHIDLLETNPARRVKLKIAYEGLSKLHPADIADIVEHLAPAEREAVFETIDEGVAAEAMEELDPKTQVSVVESLETPRAADIVEEMDPDAAANLLGDLADDRSGQILQQMEPGERREVTQLLEFGEHTAAGHMTTEFLALPDTSSVGDVIDALKRFDGGPEGVATVYVTGPGQTLVGSVSLLQIAISPSDTRLSALAERAVSCPPNATEKEVAGLFDKYNLITLAVVDARRHLTGIITADDVIAMLRHDR
jgi:magnesium transporter